MVKSEIDKNGNTKESFCGACLAIPVAMAGVGVAGFGVKKGAYKKTKTIVMVIGILITIISLIATIIFLMKCNDCR